MRNYPRRNPKPRPPGEPRRIDTGRLTASYVPPAMYRGRAPRYFVPRNRRQWKDARRHCWLQLAGIIGVHVLEVRELIDGCALPRVVDKVKKDRTKGRALVRRLDRLTACEPKPQTGGAR